MSEARRDSSSLESAGPAKSKPKTGMEILFANRRYLGYVLRTVGKDEARVAASEILQEVYPDRAEAEATGRQVVLVRTPKLEQ